MPTRIDNTGQEYQTLYVRVVNPSFVFQKDKLEWPDEKDEKHKDDPPKSFRIHVHGYDELGRRVCPIFEVPNCQEIQLAIHNEETKDPETKKILTYGRLIQVNEKDLENFPVYVGSPTIQDSPEDVVRKIARIRVEQKKGDKLLEETSRPFSLPEDDSQDSKKLRNLYTEGMKLLGLKSESDLNKEAEKVAS